MRPSQAHNFANSPQVAIQRSAFDRSHGHKTTFDAGYLVPIYVDEALPGDTFNLSMTGFARLATPIKPVMDNMYMETFFFAIPMRLVWEHFQEFMGAKENPADDSEYVMPQIQAGPGDMQEGSIFDYMGIPIHNIANFDFNALYFRAYNLVWNEWFRDQNLQEELQVNRGYGVESTNLYELKRRGKRHDYFTSCLPWPQKGESVQIPLAHYGEDLLVTPTGAAAVPTWKTLNDQGIRFLGDNDSAAVHQTPSGSDTELLQWDDPKLMVDVDSAGTINDLRIAEQLQIMLERDARGGTRYTEVIQSHFGVTSPDSRLQRPEFLGGGTSRVAIKPVEQNTPTEQETPQGNLAALGTASLHNHGFVKSFTEHTIILGLINVRADLTYQEGLERMWMRKTRYDYFWPAFAHIGEQTVLEEEIYVTGSASTAEIDFEKPEHVFGYQERYADYRYKPSKITGAFRSNHSASLDVWHLSQDFADIPQLNEEFIEDHPPVDRIVATQNEPHFLFDSFFKLKCARPMPLYGVPGGNRF